MNANMIVKEINEAKVCWNEEEVKCFDIFCQEYKRTGEIGLSPISLLSKYYVEAERELCEAAIKEANGSSGVKAARFFAKLVKENEKRLPRFAETVMISWNGEVYQTAVLCETSMLAGLRNKVDYIPISEDSDLVDTIQKLTDKMSDNFNYIDVDLNELLAETAQIKAKKEKQHIVEINHKYYDAILLDKLLRIIGTNDIKWQQDINKYQMDCLSTDRGFGYIMPCRLKPSALYSVIPSEVIKH